ncbi:Scr1 family TA system antitoxin-like transcriptional regulator [Kibdelosporangium phytohabitans]|uniref:Scr1 family TA system antitoxin-like transcriptional regulator n=1 Tax=Kibdelosporangium phytohabitans TaxID=860235 RepID=UPI003AAC11C9
MHEAASHGVVGGPEVMHGQLVHLMEVVRHPAVDLRVLPLAQVRTPASVAGPRSWTTASHRAS